MKYFFAPIVGLYMVTSFAFAQTATTTTTTTDAKMIADVNITASQVALVGNAISGSFTAQTSYGNQDNLQYGLVFQNKRGEVIAISPVLGTLSLAQKVPRVQSVSYPVPLISENADAYLTVSNASGIPLAVVFVGNIAGSKVACTHNESKVTCKAGAAPVNLALTVYQGGAYGEEIGSFEENIEAGRTVTIALSELFTDVSAGRYIVAGEVKSANATEIFAQKYSKAGARASIESVSIPDGAAGFTAVVYTNIFGFGTTTAFTLGISSDGCGEVAQTPVKGAVTELALGSNCASGTATVTLYQDGKAIDTEMMSFALPPEDKALNTTTYTLIGSIILLAALAYLILRRRGDTTSATPNTPVSAPAVTTVAGLLLAIGMFMPTQIHAATYSIDSNHIFQFCSGGPGDGCGEGGEVWAYATVTLPESVVVNGTYTMAVDQYIGASTGYMVECLDSVSDGPACDSADAKTTGFLGTATPKNLGPHQTTGNLTFTAPSTPGTITATANIDPDALYYYGCNRTYPNKCIRGIVRTSANQSVTVTAPAPTVNVQFSWFEKMFAVLALSR